MLSTLPFVIMQFMATSFQQKRLCRDLQKRRRQNVNMLEATKDLVSYQTICLGHGHGRLDGVDTVFLQKSLHDMLHVWRGFTVFRKARQADTCPKRDAQNSKSLRLHGGFLTCIRYGKFRDCCQEKGWAQNRTKTMFLNLCDPWFPHGRTFLQLPGPRGGCSAMVLKWDQVAHAAEMDDSPCHSSEDSSRTLQVRIVSQCYVQDAGFHSDVWAHPSLV